MDAGNKAKISYNSLNINNEKNIYHNRRITYPDHKVDLSELTNNK